MGEKEKRAKPTPYLQRSPLAFLILMSPKHLSFLLLFSSLFPFLILGLPDPDPATVQPLLLPNPSPPATIPAFPEQSNVAGCPLDLPDELFHGIKATCGGSGSDQLRKSRCCPVLAAWLYSAFSGAALSRAAAALPASSSGVLGSGAAPTTVAGRNTTTSYDMPLLPDDSETCVDTLGKSLREKGIELAKPNETCDLVFCFCGIRLHPLSCPEAFYVNQKGKLAGNKRVKILERHCLSSSTNVNGFPGLGGCSKCLNTLYSVSFLR